MLSFVRKKKYLLVFETDILTCVKKELLTCVRDINGKVCLRWNCEPLFKV